MVLFVFYRKRSSNGQPVHARVGGGAASANGWPVHARVGGGAANANGWPVHARVGGAAMNANANNDKSGQERPTNSGWGETFSSREKFVQMHMF